MQVVIRNKLFGIAIAREHLYGFHCLPIGEILEIAHRLPVVQDDYEPTAYWCW